MQRINTLRILAFSLVACAGVAMAGRLAGVEPPKPIGPLPSPTLLAWQEDELTLFVHFGINTFTGRSTGLGNEDPKLFNPTALDCGQWVRVAKECGFKGIILTAKHFDGFCLWPTATTAHSVKHSTWRDGKGDVVRELADACKAGGIKFGIYCSPWDRNVTNYDSDRDAYSKFYRQQLAELLGNYGPVYEVWFDGNHANVTDWPGVIGLVRKLQPDAVIKQGPRLETIREDVRWVGNEQACSPLANWSVYPAPSRTDNSETAKWFPVECNTMMVGHWFWDGTQPRDLATLLNDYYTSVGRNSLLMLNVAPDKRGLFSDDSVKRLQEFHDAIQKIFGTDFAAGKTAVASNVREGDDAFAGGKALDGDNNTYWTTDDDVTNATLEVDLGGEREFNVVRLEEMITLGQRVAEYKIEAWDDAAKDWRELNHGFTIGYRKLDRFPKITSSKVRLTILKARGCPAIKSLGVHLDTISPAEYFEPEKANFEIKLPTAGRTN
ncbi:MAG TPA: alpha-L-fucosidase [Verrucomicrobiae bacterium]|jgi:alpha-L-fucosidase|nr:alpha-L-fucosidase [Verrucomicrobiae bacterium]